MTGCLFCDIAAGKREADRVFEDRQVLAFRDIRPQAPHHILIIPKVHVTSLNQIGEVPKTLMHRLLDTAREVAGRLGMDRRGYRVVINTGPDGGQTVFHLHLHLLGGRPMGWPPG